MKGKILYKLLRAESPAFVVVGMFNREDIQDINKYFSDELHPPFYSTTLDDVVGIAYHLNTDTMKEFNFDYEGFLRDVKHYFSGRVGKDNFINAVYLSTLRGKTNPMEVTDLVLRHYLLKYGVKPKNETSLTSTSGLLGQLGCKPILRS